MGMREYRTLTHPVDVKNGEAFWKVTGSTYLSIHIANLLIDTVEKRTHEAISAFLSLRSTELAEESHRKTRLGSLAGGLTRKVS